MGELQKPHFPELAAFLERWSDQIPESKRVDFYVDLTALLAENSTRIADGIERHLKRRIEIAESSESS